ncbi:MAG TPA: hypothetical protein VF722_04520 [Gemmatimonadaceae bacterium]|jgi:hypothetical protein
MIAGIEVGRPRKSGQRRQSQQRKANAEPVGIVISRGTREEPKPTFWSYEWSAPPTARAPRAKPRAA